MSTVSICIDWFSVEIQLCDFTLECSFWRLIGIVKYNISKYVFECVCCYSWDIFELNLDHQNPVLLSMWLLLTWQRFLELSTVRFTILNLLNFCIKMFLWLEILFLFAHLILKTLYFQFWKIVHFFYTLLTELVLATLRTNTFW